MMLPSLSSRELAALFWLLLFGAWAVRNAETRHSLRDVARAAFHPFLLRFFLLTTAYVAVVLWFLSSAGVWSADLLKETVLWFGLTGLATAGRALSSYEGINYAKGIVDSFRVVVIVQFLVGLVPFSLPVELALIPLGAFIGLGSVAAERHAEGGSALRLFKSLEVILGLGILAGALRNAVASYQTLSSVEPLLSFLVPPLLSLLFIPAVFASTLYGRYEWLYGKLRGERRFRRWARWQLLRRLGLRPRAVLEFGRKYALDLPAVTDAEGFKTMLMSPSWRERQERDLEANS